MSKKSKSLIGTFEIKKAGFAKRNRPDWSGKVYHESLNDFDMSADEWRLLKYSVIKRDNRRCQRCDKRFKISDLGAHHIMSHDEGGSNDTTNLMTLCSPCHDFVEVNKLKSRAEIIGSFEGEKKDSTQDHQPLIEKKESIDWKSWVYGGHRRPNQY